MSVIAFDTNIPIYVLNNHKLFADPSIEVIKRAKLSGGCISVLLLTELFSFPALKEGDNLARAEQFIESMAGLRLIKIDEAVSRQAAALMRDNQSLKLADAVHLASAFVAGAAEFWTNDYQLQNVALPSLNIKFLTR